MAVVLFQHKISDGWFEMGLEGVAKGEPGQFLMIRSDSEALDPLLSRPISLFDAQENETRIVYQLVGRGTRMLSLLKKSDPVHVTGPLGTGFPKADGDIALIGGGVGIAPLYYLAKQHRKEHPNSNITVYLGFRETPLLIERFEAVCDRVVVDIGGYITEKVDFDEQRVFFSCGPTPMMRAAYNRAKESRAKLYVSLEERMACGVGACLGCSVPTTSGNKRVCKDGPVFDAQEVYGE